MLSIYHHAPPKKRCLIQTEPEKTVGWNGVAAAQARNASCAPSAARPAWGSIDRESCLQGQQNPGTNLRLTPFPEWLTLSAFHFQSSRSFPDPGSPVGGRVPGPDSRSKL